MTLVISFWRVCPKTPVQVFFDLPDAVLVCVLVNSLCPCELSVSCELSVCDLGLPFHYEDVSETFVYEFCLVFW